MKLFIKYDIKVVCNKLLQDALDRQFIKYTISGLGEVDLPEPLTNEEIDNLGTDLKPYGIEIVENRKSILIQRIKDAIIEIVYMEEKINSSKISSFLANKLNLSYGYISNVFSEVTYSSIENYTILQKIERAKQLIILNELTFTEIAWQLNYSSVAHFSTQFKHMTGLTPSAFERIIKKRRSLANKDD